MKTNDPQEQLKFLLTVPDRATRQFARGLIGVRLSVKQIELTKLHYDYHAANVSSEDSCEQSGEQCSEDSPTETITTRSTGKLNASAKSSNSLEKLEWLHAQKLPGETGKTVAALLRKVRTEPLERFQFDYVEWLYDRHSRQ